MSVHIAEDQIHICLVAKHNIIEDLEAELCELNRPASHLFDLFALFFGDAFGHPAGMDVHGWTLRPPIISTTVCPYLRI